MATNELIAAMQRAESVFQRRPESGLHEDTSATSRWQGGTRIATSHPNGTQISSDMPTELGGTGDCITPGWLFRAGIAACSTTTIRMAAAARGVDLSSLEVQVKSQSDARGLLGMTEPDGTRVSARPRDFEMFVRIRAPKSTPADLRAVVEEGLLRSPVSCAIQGAVAMTLHIDAGAN
jgi:uncharacterized OsmC-like protein